MLGQTATNRWFLDDPLLVAEASMEGRAMARPDRGPARRRVVIRCGRFNGGPSNCSARHMRTPRVIPRRESSASMEGRAIARPDQTVRHLGSFTHRRPQTLQWRAEQLLGQTVACMHGAAVHAAAVASMEAEQWLGQTWVPPKARELSACSTLQWRAEQWLGQTVWTALNCSCIPAALQWRAEQLLGQTAGRLRGRIVLRGTMASMEGRAIARPDANSGYYQRRDAAPCRVLQWRAEQLLGQTYDP